MRGPIRAIGKRLSEQMDPVIACGDKRTINQENRMAIHLLAWYSLVLSLVTVLSQIVVTGITGIICKSLWLVGYSLWMICLDRFILPEDYEHCLPLIYFLETPMMVMAVLLCTFWDPFHQANTVMLYLMSLPPFILDRFDRLLAFEGGWAVLFLTGNALVKEPALRYIDGVHVLEYFLATVMLSFVIMSIRLASLKNLREARYRFEHSSRVACLNSHALQRRKERYLGNTLVLVFADMDQLKFLNDFYGHDAGDQMLRFTIGVLREVFGEEDTYHFGGDEALCILSGSTIARAEEEIARCQEKLGSFTWQSYPLPLSCTFGYVQGTPRSHRRFDDMVHLADIYAHQAKNGGSGKVIGGVYDDKALQDGILEANVSARARAYEINGLTGLPRMSYFIARANELLESGVEKKAVSMIGYFQLIGLRDFNNQFGYVQGDALIAYTGQLLQRAFAHRLVCYITAGQFCILCYQKEIPAALEEVNEVLWGYRPGFRVLSKAGFSAYEEGKDAIGLLDEARMAQKSIKNARNLTYRFYDGELDEEEKLRQYVVTHLDEALEKGYLKVFYQPIVRQRTGKVCNEEALSRWEDPCKGFLLPGQFIPVLEENGLMYKVSLHVVRQVLKDMETRKKEGVPIVPVSINLSRKDFDACDMVQEISRLVEEAGVSPSMLKMEITESAFISEQGQLRAAVEGFHRHGFEVWLDDFGSEYSTLNLLQEMDFDVIKLDMQFMRHFTRRSKNYLIISAVIEMSRQMGITTLVEGIETEENLRLLSEIGCDKLQGYYYNRPNCLEYIMERAKNGTGLVFEKGREEDLPVHK